MGTIERALRTATIRTRVAILATLIALFALLALGYQQLSTMSATFTRVAENESLTLTTQLASATAGAGAEVVGVIPYTSEGLDGVVVFDRDGRVQASRGALAPLLRELGPDAARVARSGRPAQEFRLPDGRGSRSGGSELRPWSPEGTVQVTIVPQGDGALAAGFHVEWATSQVRSTAISTSMGLIGGSLFLCFGLMLTIGRQVTRPIGRLGAEVRRLDDGEAGARLSQQGSPELQQLAADITQMHEALTQAIEESSTDPLTGIANHRAFHDRLAAAVDSSAGTGDPLALIAIDLDRLKLINDRCGHVAGDRVIAAVASQMVAVTGGDELCARIGGDEFVIVCPGSDRDRATAIAARLAAAVSGLSLAGLTGVQPPEDIDPSISFGVAVLHADADSKEALIHAADAALYEAKFGRRDAQRRDAEPVVAAPEAAVAALALAIEAKDARTRSHCERVAVLAVDIGRCMRLDDTDLDALRRSALLHDVGKIGMPDAVLLKPDRLTEGEFAVMKEHPALGYRIVRSAGLDTREALWVLHHHEHFDGSGYPHALSGNEIPLGSRIILVADAFDAMTVDRPYRRARSAEDAVVELRRCADVEFDTGVVEVLAGIVAERAGGPPLYVEQLVAAGRLA
jgi:diguanylate cyclase (GGDEF)-like protein/putative nucleotidyltransferase with HDIG domain